MTESPARRSFMTRGALLGGGLLLARPARSAGTNETLSTLQGLRTVHGNFTDKEIPNEQVETILQTCLRAANSSNMQTYSIVVTRDRSRMKELCGYAGSCLMVFLVDYNRILASARALGYGYNADTIEHFVTGAINTALAAQTAVVAGRALGIDSLLTNGIHRGDMDRVWKILDLPPQGCFPLIALVLGYPASEPKHQRGRLTGTGVIHRDRYHHLTKEETNEITRRYDDPQAQIAMVDWKSMGHAHYLDWLFKVWLKGGGPAQAETAMLRFLKRSGFVDLQKP